MKLSCPFCKTEYSADIAAGRRVECACCGHVWAAPKSRGGGFLMWLAALCLALSAAAFITAAAVRHWPRSSASAAALVVELDRVRQESGGDGESYWTVGGRIRNASDKIFGIPDFVVHMKNAAGETLATERFAPPAPLLGAGEHLEFRHRMESVPPDARKFSVELANH